MTFKKIAFTLVMNSLCLTGILPLMAEPSKPVTAGNLIIQNYWIRSSSGPNTAAYLTIASNNQKDKLIKVDCADAATVELHNHIEENGVMKMRPVPSVEIEEEPVVFKSGGLHIMLMGLEDSFKGKESVPLALHFEKAGIITVDFPVKKRE